MTGQAREEEDEYRRGDIVSQATTLLLETFKCISRWRKQYNTYVYDQHIIFALDLLIDLQLAAFWTMGYLE